jgi:HNH endonuclease
LPDVASSMRKLPTACRSDAVGESGAEVAPQAQGSATGSPARLGAAGSTPVPRSVPVAHRAVVAPLSADRYRLQVTLQEAAHDDLRSLQDLMRREIPDGDPAAIVARALKLLREEAEKKAFAATTKPRPAGGSKARSRHIPARVERAVWQRDGGQCAFEGPSARCGERSFLEFHHVSPWIVGGSSTPENIALRCRAHNAHEAEVYFEPIRAAMVGRDVDSFRNETRAAAEDPPGPAP